MGGSSRDRSARTSVLVAGAGPAAARGSRSLETRPLAPVTTSLAFRGAATLARENPARRVARARCSLLLVVLSVSFSLVGCSQPVPVRRDVVMGLAGEPRSVMSDEPGARVLQAAVTETLVRRDRDGEFVARLAEEVPTFANGGLRIVIDDATPQGRLVATFEIRAGAKWQDGAPITTGDVRFALDEDRAAPPGSERRWMADRVERIDLLDDRSVRFVYRAGERWELYPLAPRVLPAHVLANATAEKRAAYDREPMHAGPFAVAAWIAGFGMTLSAFQSYADGTRLQAHYTAATAVEMLRVGRRGALAEGRVRMALLVAIDRRGLVDGLFAGRARVPRSYLVPPHPVAIDVLDPPRLDRDGARAMLAAAGLRPGNLGVLERDGERMSITLQVAAGSQARMDAARRVAGDLATSGIAASVLERSLADVRAAVSRGDFDLALVPEPTDDPQQASERYRGSVDAWFDVLVDAASDAREQSDKRAIYGELQRLWAQALPGIPLYQQLLVDVAPRALEGVQPSPYGDPLTWNARDWRFVTNLN